MAALRQDMGIADVVAIGVSAAVGISIFSVVSPATAVAGPAMLGALALAALPMVVFAVVYAFMASADPRTGSSYVWPTLYVHPFAGFMVCWLRILGSAGALFLMAKIFSSYLSQFVVLPEPLVIVGLLTAVFALNVLGVGHAARTARWLTAFKLLVLGAFIAVGLMHLKPESFRPLAPHGIGGIVASLALLVGLFSGIESATEAGEEVRDSRRAVGVGLAWATAISLVVYLGVSVVAIGVLGAPKVADGSAPLADAAARFAGGWTVPVLVVTALVSISAAMNAQFLILMRFIYAMADDGALPAPIASIHPRWGTPWVAAVVTWLASLASMALPSALVFLFLAVNVPTVLKYLFNCLAAFRLVGRHPEIHAAAAFRLSARAVRGWAVAGLICAVVLLAAGVGADWRPYAVLAAWGAIGTVYWLLFPRRRRPTALAAAHSD
jgi:APA family basic amino acid/polyamine antiporter